MTQPDDVGTHSAEPQGVSFGTPQDRNRGWRIVDGVLIVAALASSMWALSTAMARSDPPLLRTMELVRTVAEVDPFCYIDATNVVRWASGSADGEASLAFSLPAVPTDVALFVHPDSLIEPMARTIGVLRQRGAQRIRILLCRQNPFTDDRQEVAQE